jgi:hypothetical protein
VPIVDLARLCGLLILRLGRRLLLLANVTAHPAAELVTSRIAEACPWGQVPRDLICDRNWVAVVKRQLRARGIRDRPIATRSPTQGSHGERPAACDHVVNFGALHPRCVMANHTKHHDAVHARISRSPRICHRPACHGLWADVHRVVMGGSYHHCIRFPDGIVGTYNQGRRAQVSID